MSTNKTYKIETLQQLVNIVNDENIESLISDLSLWLQHTNLTFNMIKDTHPELKDKLNSEIARVGFEWTDDGENKINGIKIHDTTTGEVTNVV